ncbi:MAG: hypothetical protein JST58_11480 [Bacteroidetes bacterium]|nr:hypothetical protein [Bacteroidota bacterium]
MKKRHFLSLSILLLLFCHRIYAQVGIGTSTPDASAQLDVTATDKGFLPPRVALTSTTDASTISSPASGLLVYNSSTAGNSPSNVTPGYYYWSGSSWSRVATYGNVIASGSVTVSATGTAPTLGSTVYINKTQAIDYGAKKRITVQLGFSGGGTAGSGNYLFSLAPGITFNTAAGYNPVLTTAPWSPDVGTDAQYFIPAMGGIVQSGSWSGITYVVPYSSTQYTLVSNNNNTNSIMQYSQSWYLFSVSTMINLSFDIY